jgi:hypothetical protein
MPAIYDPLKATTLHMLLISALLSSAAVLSSQEPQKDHSVVTRAVIEGPDTIAILELPEVSVYEKRDFEYLYLKRRYRRMILNIKKAYPYARIAGVRLKELDDHLVTLDSEKERKEYIDLAEKEIMTEFEKDVRHLTVTQGIILVKLIDRETGRTSYQVIKELKGGFTAFFWQGIARIFGNNLKTEYDPADQDKVMEDIVLGIEAGFI